eukprot:14297535-Alexandrium_andersonii.AAC.1
MSAARCCEPRRRAPRTARNGGWRGSAAESNPCRLFRARHAARPCQRQHAAWPALSGGTAAATGAGTDAAEMAASAATDNAVNASSDDCTDCASG